MAVKRTGLNLLELLHLCFEVAEDISILRHGFKLYKSGCSQDWLSEER